MTAREVIIDGERAAVLPNGRLITPAGVEVGVDAPKPYGLVLAPGGDVLATVIEMRAAILASEGLPRPSATRRFPD